MLGVMETLVYPLRELVKKQDCGYDFTIFENETMSLLMDRTRKMRAQDVGTEHTLCRYTKDAM